MLYRIVDCKIHNVQGYPEIGSADLYFKPTFIGSIFGCIAYSEPFLRDANGVWYNGVDSRDASVEESNYLKDKFSTESNS